MSEKCIYRSQRKALEEVKANIEAHLRTINLILDPQPLASPADYYNTVGLALTTIEFEEYIIALKNKSTLTINELQHLIVYYLRVNFDFNFTLPERCCYYESDYLMPGKGKKDYCSAQTPEENHTAGCEEKFIVQQNPAATCEYYEFNAKTKKSTRAKQIYTKALYCEGRYDELITFVDPELKGWDSPAPVQGFYLIQRALANQKLGNLTEALKDLGAAAQLYSDNEVMVISWIISTIKLALGDYAGAEGELKTLKRNMWFYWGWSRHNKFFQVFNEYINSLQQLKNLPNSAK